MPLGGGTSLFVEDTFFATACGKLKLARCVGFCHGAMFYHRRARYILPRLPVSVSFGLLNDRSSPSLSTSVFCFCFLFLRFVLFCFVVLCSVLLCVVGYCLLQVVKFTEGKEVKKFIYVPGRIISFVVK